MRRDIEHKPQKYLSINVVVCRLLPFNHLIPKDKLSYSHSPGGMLCASASIGWCKIQTTPRS